ncbi:MAG: radical SAM protein [Deltaproteobacteria bacterium]|nr:radical SAM protein [Deltaproteobacteria bacterium]
MKLETKNTGIRDGRPQQKGQLLEQRIEQAHAMLASCHLCPRCCGVNRLKNEIGVCGVGRHAQVASFGPHMGEESCLVGRHGSGAVFFAGCNLRCAFCQNWDIAHRTHVSQEVSADALAKIFLSIHHLGCHNLNLVTPTHVLPQILEALPVVLEGGFDLPIVWNCGGYESVAALELLDGIVDIYMPDIKFFDKELARRYLNAPDYPDICMEAFKEMHRQVGDLIVENSMAKSGMLVRHLAMPNAGDDAAKIMSFLKSLSVNTAVNVMNQYHPCHEAVGDAQIGTVSHGNDLQRAREAAVRNGLRRVDQWE